MTMKNEGVTGRGVKDDTKRMDEMKGGEVCFVLSSNHYVLRLPYNTVFLILDSDATANTYSGPCGRLVRPLKDDESVTIRFS